LNGGNFARGFAARENSLAGEACEGISGFAAKRFALAPTPASYAGYIFRCCRFPSIRKGYWDYGGEADVVDFTVDKDIMLHGLCLCGSETSDYSVDLTIRVIGCKPDYLPHTLVSKTGRFSSKLLQPANYYGFEILFDPTITCTKNIKYEIRAVISGSTSWVGSGGVSTVVCSGVTFTFTDNANCSNGTSTRSGQFPEILFSFLP